MTRDSLFAKALENGDAFLDLGSMRIYRFDEYAKFKSMNWPTSGVYITNPEGVIEDIWNDGSVMFYIENLQLEPKWLKDSAS